MTNLQDHNRQYITVISYPKSGATWTSRLLGDILDSPVKSNTHGRKSNAIADEGFNRTGKFEIKQWHGTLKGEAENSLYVYIYRDPRDVCLSVRDYWRMKDLDAVLFNKNTRPPNPVAPSRGWQKHLDDYFHKSDTHIDYALLRKNTEKHLRVILMDLGITGYDDRIAGAVKRQSIANRKKMIESGAKMSYNEQIQSNLIRMGGRVGAWKKEWKRHHGEAVYEAWWDWMRMLKIEEDENWWQKLPEE